MTKKTYTSLGKALWDITGELRESMYVRDFRNYMLSILFLRSLSDRYVEASREELGAEWPTLTKEDCRSPLAIWYEQNAKGSKEFESVMRRKLHFVLLPEFLWDNITEMARAKNTELLETLRQGFKFIEIESFSSSFRGLFSMVNLDFRRLGKDIEERNARLCTFIVKIDQVLAEFSDEEELLGDAFEFLIDQFAAATSNKVGEFYTPQRISDIVSGIVTLDCQNPALGKREKLNRVYDFACGSGSLLLNVHRHMDGQGIGKLYGQEINITTHNLARMNMLLHGLPSNEFEIYRGDTLENDWDILSVPNSTRKIQFDAVVANPTFSYSWEPKVEMARDCRFRDHGVAPRFAADFAFLLHGFHFLAKEGTMAIVLHSGALLRSDEKKIREKLLRDGNIDTVIGLPTNLFYSTGSPACILILKKCVCHDDVLIINAAKQFDGSGFKKHLSEEHVRKILETYQYRKEEERFSRRVTLEEIEKQHDFNLKVSLYVNTDEPEPEVNPHVVQQQPADLRQGAVSETLQHNGYVTKKDLPTQPLESKQDAEERSE